MLNIINSNEELDKYYNIKFYKQEKYFNIIFANEEDSEIVETIDIIYDGGGV